MTLLEKMQLRFTKNIPVPAGLIYKERMELFFRV